MDRDHELRIKGHLYEITELNDEVLDSRQGFPMSEEGYRKTLKSVAECAGADMVDDVAGHIKTTFEPKRSARRTTPYARRRGSSSSKKRSFLTSISTWPEYRARPDRYQSAESQLS